ncbi:MAG: hypothetical protein GC165_06315 [Armatimonadetes bacterium]|nr:hypothetical protein [Armatimonadota bacterium]
MLQAPSDTRSNAMATWVEASLIIDQGLEGFLPYSIFLEEIDSQNLSSADLESETLLSDLKRTLVRRQSIVGDVYPLRIGKTGISTNSTQESTHHVHDFLVLLSLAWTYDDLSYKNGAASTPSELFEELVAHAMASYIGGRSFRFGAPRRAPVPVPFRAAVEYVSSETAEMLGNVEDFVDGHEKDDGLDVIAWKPFPDNMPGQLVTLTQCAIGRNWKDKLGDLAFEEGAWQTRLALLTKPTRAMAIPGIYDSDRTSWHTDSKRAGMILDRLRLEFLLKDIKLPNELNSSLKNWNASRVSEVRLKQRDYLTSF